MNLNQNTHNTYASSIRELIDKLEEEVSKYKQFQNTTHAWIYDSITGVVPDMVQFMNSKAADMYKLRKTGGIAVVSHNIIIANKPMYIHADVLFYLADDDTIHHYPILIEHLKITEHL